MPLAQSTHVFADFCGTHVTDQTSALQIPGGFGDTLPAYAEHAGDQRQSSLFIASRKSESNCLRTLWLVKSAGDDRALHFSETLSSLQDLDYAKAASELMQQQVNLEAAQKSFIKVAGLSLFNYL